MKAKLPAQFAPTAIAMIGTIVLFFPTIANWFSSLGYVQQAASYSQEVSELTAVETERLLERAEEYNKSLPNGPLRDPYMLTESGEYVDLRDGMDDYRSQLFFGNDSPMAWLTIPSINQVLPVFHGTDEDTLRKGAGHMYGSALPVGGASTHSVITAHAGLVEAKLFSDLYKVKIGDVFKIAVPGRTVYYQVASTEVVAPVYTGEALRQIQGEDHVTLLTCTPTGVNSHRLLVQGKRIPSPEDDATGGLVGVGDYRPDFPWWALLVAGAPTTVWGALTAIDKRQQQSRVRERRSRTLRELTLQQ